MKSLIAGIRLLRPKQWLKNAFVLAGPFFAFRTLNGGLVADALVAFTAFCLASGAVYVLNDLLDRDTDREHPRKQTRPLAAGSIRTGSAIILGLACAAGSLALAGSVDPRLLAVVAAYLAVNATYSRFLKHVVLVDVFCIAAGFLLRLLAGTWGIGIPPSQWFMLCTFLLSLFLGFSKRYAERMDTSLAPEARRAVIAEYSPEFLRVLLAVTGGCTLMAYGLYTMSPQTVAVHGTQNLIYTLPFAAFVMFRYLWLVLERGHGEDLAGELVRDRPLLVASGVYIVATALLLAP